jgi:hypothetical protein
LLRQATARPPSPILRMPFAPMTIEPDFIQSENHRR